MILHSYLWHPSWLLMYCGRTVTNSQQRCSIKKLLTNSYKFCNIHRKKPVLRSLLNTLEGFQACSFSKNWLQHRCFLWILGNFKVIEIWKLSRFENLTEMDVLGKIHHFEFMLSVITIVQAILSSWNLVWVSFLRREIQKSHLKRVKNKPVLKYLRFQDLGTCDWIGVKKYMWPDR